MYRYISHTHTNTLYSHTHNLKYTLSQVKATCEKSLLFSSHLSRKHLSSFIVNCHVFSCSIVVVTKGHRLCLSLPLNSSFQCLFLALPNIQNKQHTRNHQARMRSLREQCQSYLCINWFSWTPTPCFFVSSPAVRFEVLKKKMDSSWSQASYR